jgi:hypothetical protein
MWLDELEITLQRFPNPESIRGGMSQRQAGREVEEEYCRVLNIFDIGIIKEAFIRFSSFMHQIY